MKKQFFLSGFSLCLVAVLTLGLGGCGLRIDTGSYEAPKSSLNVEVRNLLAQVQDQSERSANLVAEKSEGLLKTQLEKTATQAQIRLKLLGGLWTPWPNGKPSEAPALVEALPQSPDARAIVKLLESGAKLAKDFALIAQNPQEQRLTTLLALSQELSARNLHTALETAKGSETNKASDAPLELPKIKELEEKLKQLRETATEKEGKSGQENQEQLGKLGADIDYWRYQIQYLGSLGPKTDRAALIARATALMQELDWAAQHYQAPIISAQYPPIKLENQADPKEISTKIVEAERQILNIHLELVTQTLPEDFSAREYWIKAASANIVVLQKLGVSEAQIFTPLFAVNEPKQD